MKKTLLIFAAFVLSSVSVSAADAKADALIARMKTQIERAGNYSLTFTGGVEGGQIGGKMLISDRRFRIETPGFDIVGDNEVRYEANHELEEIVIDLADTSDVSIFVNPSRAFEFAQGGFDATYEGEVSHNGEVCDVVALSPKYQGSAITGIRVLINRASGLPAGLHYALDGLTDELVIDVTGLEGGVSVTDADFVLDMSQYGGYEVIDFR